MDLALVMFTERGERRDFPITKSKVVIGRTTECDLQIPLPEVSRRHCELAVEEDKVAVRDLGSSNGTYVNKKRIQQVNLGAGETLTVGPVVFTVVINGMPEDIEPVRTVLHRKKKKKASVTAGAKAKDDTGSVDLGDLAEAEVGDDGHGSGSAMPVELEELSKQHMKRPAKS